MKGWGFAQKFCISLLLSICLAETLPTHPVHVFTPYIQVFSSKKESGYKWGHKKTDLYDCCVFLRKYISWFLAHF